MAGIVLRSSGPKVFVGTSYSEEILLSKQSDACLVVMVSADSDLYLTSATLEGVPLPRATDGQFVAGQTAQGTDTRCYVVSLANIASGYNTLAFTRANSNQIVLTWAVVAGVDPQPLAVRNGSFGAASSVSVALEEREENALTLQMVTKTGANDELLVDSPFRLLGQNSGLNFGGHQTGVAHYGGFPDSAVTWTSDASETWNTTTLVFSSSTPNALTEETQHFEDGLRSLAGPFWGKPRIAALLRSYLRRTQEEEAVYWQVLRAFHPETATGVALELLGKIVGQPKLGFTEDEHRALIRGRIRTNRSFGGHQDLLEIIQAVALTTAPTHIYQLPFMTVYIVPEERLKAAEAEAMLVLLPDGRAAGVRMFVMLAYETASEPYDYSDLGLLFSDSVDPSTTPGAAWFDTRQV